jgi:hypothetical protein
MRTVAPTPADPVPVRLPRRRVSVNALREAAQGAVNRTSLRRVARDVGVSAPGLALFLDGSIPRDSTLAKIRVWYFSDAASRSDTTPETARTAIELLLEPLPNQAVRSRVLTQIVVLLAKTYEEQGIVAPAWLRELSAAAPQELVPSTREEHDPGKS